MMAVGALNVVQIISHKFCINDAEQAYNLIFSGEPSLGIVLEYPGLETKKKTKTISFEYLNSNKNVNPKRAIKKTENKEKVHVSFIGCGNYANSVLIPSFKSAGATLLTAASMSGATSAHSAKKFNFSHASTDIESVFKDSETEALVISTRHNSHAEYVSHGLLNKKSVFVEKPLCITLEELKKIESNLKKVFDDKTDAPILMVGFNRRFSPHCKKIKSLAEEVNPKALFLLLMLGLFRLIIGSRYGSRWRADYW